MFFDPVCDARRIDQQTKFDVSFLCSFREIRGGYKCLQAVNNHALRMHRTIRLSCGCQGPGIVIDTRQTGPGPLLVNEILCEAPDHVAIDGAVISLTTNINTEDYVE